MGLSKRRFRKSAVFFGIFIGFAFYLSRFFLDLDKRLVWSIDSIVKSNKLFRGVILITKNNKIIYEKSYNDKALEKQQFLVASIVKQFTSVLILKEVEKGRINLSEKANAYLLNHQKINNRITVHHLLTHTSGIFRNGNQYSSNVKFLPGSQYEYSNYAYVVLGYILKNVTGRNFDDLLREILQQNDMTASFTMDSDTIGNVQKKHPCFVSSYLLQNGKYKETPKTIHRECIYENGNPIFFSNPCGGLVSTANDLNKWNCKLHSGKILSENMYKLMTKGFVKSNFPEGYYGYGVCMPSKHEIWHIGYAYNYKTTLSYFPEHKISLAILENISIENNYEMDFEMHKNIRKSIHKYIEKQKENITSYIENFCL